MSTIIQIKRSSTTTAPSSLASGELAYSTKTGVQKLYYGDGTDVLAIGGKSYTDKLDGIESGATADQTNAEIRTAVEAASDSNVFTDADHTKLNAIEASADVTDTTNVVAALTAGNGITIASNGTIAAGALALTSVNTAANQTAHLALTTEEGDVVIRSDESIVSFLVDEIGDVIEVEESTFEPPIDTMQGVSKDLIRLSVGIEAIEDLKADLKEAFSKI
mgnify:CR=1 FL=1